MKKNNKFIYPIFFLLIVLVFKSWFFLTSLSSGDWGFLFTSEIKKFSINPYLWNISSNGIGANDISLASLHYFYSFTALIFNHSKIFWVLIERLVWFWPFLIISVFSSYYLFKNLFSNKFALLASFIYLFNSYILMIVGGGQMGIAIAYSIVPLVLYSFINLLRVNELAGSRNLKSQISNLKLSLLAGILLSVLVMFDPRVAYITMIGVGLYWLLNLFLSLKYPILTDKLKTQNSKIKITAQNSKLFIDGFLFVFIVPIIIASLLHVFWLLPFLIYHQNPLQQLGSAYSTTEAVRYFSFAKFEDTISLLHPFWPENIFGKVGFMKPEFLLLSILAYSSLIFINVKRKAQSEKLQLKTQNFKNNLTIIFFVLLGLVGAFLAKGANEPFGGAYLWMFQHVPGFIMFRDPTKWYVLVAISYSILIPFSIWNIYDLLKSKIKNQKSKIYNAQNLFLLVIVFGLLYLIRPALFGQLTGTFKSHKVPGDYIKLEKFLYPQKTFFRTFWVPTTQRFGFYSNNHPAIPAQDFFKTVDYPQILKELKMRSSEELLKEAAVKYVIVPYDSEEEIFLKDRKYNNNIYQKTINEVKQIPYLKQISGFGKIAVFEVPDTKGHFWLNSKFKIQNSKISYQNLSPVEYIVHLTNVRKGERLVFSESYDVGWMATSVSGGEYKVLSIKYGNRFNSFILRKSGNYTFDIYYYPQILMNIGMVISGLTLLSVLGCLIYLRKKKL